MKKLLQYLKQIDWKAAGLKVIRPFKINLHKIDDGLMRLFQISWRLVVGIIAIVLMLFIYRGFKDENYAIKAFLVPKEFSDAGFSGLVVANKLFDEVKAIQDFVASQKEDILNIQSEIKPDLNLDVMGFGFSVNSTIYYLRDLMGKENRFISGELTDLSGDLSLTLRLTGHPPKVVVATYEGDDKKEAFQTIMHEGAKAMLELLDPYRLAVYHYKKGDENLSLDLIREIIKGKPEEAAWGYLAWGNLLNQQEKPDKACEKFKKATDISPRFLLAYANWAWATLTAKNYKEAIPLFEKALTLNPQNASYYNGLAICNKNLEQYDKADYYYSKAIETQPHVIWWYGNWASFKYAVLKDTVAATEIMVMANKNLPESDDFYMSRSGYYFFQNKTDSAIIMIEKALEINPNNTSALSQFAQALYRNKSDYAGARKLMWKKIEIIIENPRKVENPKYQIQNALNFIAMMDYSLEQYDSAMVHVNQAIEIAPDIDYPYSTLAEIHGLKGEKEAFYQAVEKASERGFDFKPYVNQEPYIRFREDERFNQLIGKIEEG